MPLALPLAGSLALPLTLTLARIAGGARLALPLARLALPLARLALLAGGRIALAAGIGETSPRVLELRRGPAQVAVRGHAVLGPAKGVAEPPERIRGGRGVAARQGVRCVAEGGVGA